MGVVIECVMLFAALLADLLLGNYGFTPCLTMYVLFHSSRCVSLRFAAVGALVLGTLIDLLYCRASLSTALWYILALCAGHAALFRRESDGSGRLLRISLAGAAIGGVLALRWILSAAIISREGYFEAAIDLVCGAAAGILKLALVVMAEDFICVYLGVGGFFKGDSVVVGASGGGRRRLRQVRAEKMKGKKR